MVAYDGIFAWMALGNPIPGAAAAPDAAAAADADHLARRNGGGRLRLLQGSGAGPS